ncbi:transporter substrate-binding domain-containing protein [Psychrobacter sp. I-STPA10]|uniref:transporter substrate-binding domain-containing protein n=1 Tax=Psychrobacter sp. I-STPA10 TaxID=2585769 RepID=UPI001E5B8635|nr:transporter substrate-binding domain-containing protein [Psychrobacter sp. I-STPA10]
MLKAKLVWSSMAMAAMVSLGACSQQANEETATTTDGDQTAETQHLRIATEGAYPPFNFTNPDGTLGGFDVEVAKALCTQMQADCEIVAQDWDGIIPGLLAKKYDAVVAGMSITDERLEKVDFTEPYFANTMVWLAKKDSNFDPNNISGKSLGGQRSTTPGTYLQDNYEGKNDNHVNLYDSYDNAYLDLKSGRSDAVLAEKVSAKDWLKTNPDFIIVGDEIDNNDNIAIAVRKGDGLKAEFDKALTAIRENGELAKLEQASFDQ